MRFIPNGVGWTKEELFERLSEQCEDIGTEFLAQEPSDISDRAIQHYVNKEYELLSRMDDEDTYCENIADLDVSTVHWINQENS